MFLMFMLIFLSLHVCFCGFSRTKEFIFPTPDFLKLSSKKLVVCSVWLHMRETNQGWKEVLLEYYSRAMKPTGQNAIVLKEGTTASDLETDRTFCFSLCLSLFFSVDQLSLFQRHMEENLALLSSWIYMFQAQLHKNRMNKSLWIPVPSSWNRSGTLPDPIHCTEMASHCTEWL